ncbi:uncharacterized protein DS421_19g657500 [Arachis hypogaea]|uniref:Uncharacterized protein n=1 Tax=Arachis hypogaea TaxID=3818 RepID=A0A6B9VB75_ARAHY|nr:uncharacterized protein DS421_19g657500 [Arachis hypogaea]
MHHMYLCVIVWVCILYLVCLCDYLRLSATCFTCCNCLFVLEPPIYVCNWDSVGLW